MPLSARAPLLGIAVAVWLCAAACGEETGEGNSAVEPPPASPRQEFLAIADRLDRADNPYVGRATLLRLRAQEADLGARPLPERVGVRAALARKLLEVGEEPRALEQVQAAIADAEQAGPLDRQGAGLLRLRGLVHLRMAERANCVARHNAECCIFPLRGGAVHDQQAPAERAAEDYLAYLERIPATTRRGRTNPEHLEGRWLLNIAWTALGRDPMELPEGLRLPPDAFDSETEVGLFRDVAPDLGLDTLNPCGGAIVDDFDGDGRLDVVTSTIDPRGPLRFFRNAGDGSFQDRSAAAGTDQQLGGLNCNAADFDGDGDLDVLVLRGAWYFDEGQIRNSLLRNEGDGTFVDVTRAAGLAEPAQPTQTAAWLDFDLDGDLDLYVGNESRAEASEDPVSYPGQLFRNEGDGTFSDVAAAAGATNDRYCKGVAAGDYDNDGDMDLYLSNVGLNRLYRNEGDGTFRDVAREAGVDGGQWTKTFATWFFDFDNDGWLDLFVGGYQARLADHVADVLDQEHGAVLPSLYRNRGDGTFEEVTGGAGLARVWLPMGANFADVDGDGWLDFYLATGEPDFEMLVPNALLRNDAGRRFQDATTSAGLGHLQKGHGVAFADIDDDGDLDLFNQLGGFFQADAFQNALFLNPGHGHRFVTLRLVGTRSHPSGHGARVRVVVEDSDGEREIHRAPGAVSSFGGSPVRLHVGLGDAQRIARIDVRWPVSRAMQVLEDVPLDATIRVVEGQPGFEILPREPIDLSAGN